ncbi:GFA family protein [Prosthecomicrobium hirschii]|uniref:GFA family protein n=1 Tax=Prosthecodimorpha hirschii TaxID=665126 RepID=UPI00221ED442|nr:GFA family protein [Prosthecomicrobium hirschii]MCW1840727.1 GFA family protein [Prosthecomicrobium hirschii]
MSYQGSCHCGKVTFSVDADIPDTAMSCNCSHCRRKGFLLTFVPEADFTLHTGAEDLTEYRFYKHVIAHLFCTTCGTEAFMSGTKPDGSAVRGINLRCVPAADLDALTIKRVDGARF